jgi:ribonuclease P protein component
LTPKNTYSSENIRLGKDYKLCLHKVIEDLYAPDALKSKQFPFAINFKLVSLPNDLPFQIVLSAPKRKFRDANQRNRIKRLMRECVRLNKQNLEQFLSDSNLQVALFMVYTHNQEEPLAFLEKKTQQLFRKVIEQITIETKQKQHT